MELKQIGKVFLDCKLWVQRAGSYISIINTGLIALLFFKTYGVELSAKTWGIPIFIFTIIVFTIVGYFDEKLGLYKYEVKRSQEQNEDIHEIKEDIKELLRKYSGIKK